MTVTVVGAAVAYLVTAACVGRFLRLVFNTRWRWPTIAGAVIVGGFLAGAFVSAVTL